MGVNSHGFMDWREQYVSQERGNRVVHYYLKDSGGDSILAVVGTERSVRHMVYVVAEEFLQVCGSDRLVNAGFKWRSRREVVDWLSSLVSRRPPRDFSKSPKNGSILGSTEFLLNGRDAPGAHLSDHTISRRLKGHNSDIFWSGDSWICGKQLKHYPAFWRNGITISIHSFVFVMGKEGNHYLAYLEDMYEDRKALKKVRARWFHDNQEVDRLITLPNPCQGEVFITPHAQVISAECVDGPAIVLTPEHYEKCLAVFPNVTSARINLCSRQFKNNRIISFDLSKLRGYFEQEILSCLEEEEFNQGGNAKQGAKKTRSCRGRPRFVTNHSGVRMSGGGSQLATTYQNLRFGFSGRRALAAKHIGAEPYFSLPFKVDEKIEFLCQDSGIRGCWFRCKILQLSRKKVKVQYEDVQDAVDGCGNLEEWIPAIRVANSDKLGLRCSGRLTIRPRPPPHDMPDGALEIGLPVDAWWHNGWWEGVVTEVESCGNDSIQVYFPGECVFSTFERKNLRISRDWIRDLWVDLEANPDILSTISAAVSPGVKLSSCTTIANKVTESGSSIMSDREIPTTQKLDTVEEDNQELTASPISQDLPENVNLLRRPEGENDCNGSNGDQEDTDNDDDNNGDRADTMEEDIEASGHKCEAKLMEVDAVC